MSPPPFLSFALATVATQAGHVVAALASDGAGGLAAIYFGAYLVCAALAPGLVERLGLARAWRLGAGLNAAGALALWIGKAGALGIVGRGLAGGGYGLLLVCLEAWCLARPAPQQALARYLVVFYLAAGAAQLLPLAPELLGGALPLIALAAMGARLAAPPPLTDLARPHPRILRVAPAASLAILGSGVVFGALYAGGPAFARAVAPGPLAAAAFMIVLILAGGLLQNPAARLAQSLGRGPVLLGVLTLLPVAAAFAAQGPGHFGIGLAGGAATGALAALIYPLSLGLLAERIDARSQAAASGTCLVVLAAGSALGPLLADGIQAPVPGAGAWPLTVAVGLASASALVFARLPQLLRGRRRPRQS